ncbi:MAG TPA: hypothetical protein VF628_11110 [Allosphingosinicella sp.]|jgi:hypothetical protein
MAMLILFIALPIAVLAFLLARRATKQHMSDLPVGRPGNPESWEVGPIVRGFSRTPNVPLRPRRHPGGLAIDIPMGDPDRPEARAGDVRYVTFNPGSLAGRKRLTLRYRVELDEGVRLFPWTGPPLPALLTMFLQRAGDDWSAAGKFETYRWWAGFATVMPIEPGDHELIVALDGRWTATISSNAHDHSAAFKAALTHACRVGFTLGGGDGLGHGICATGPARLIIQDFLVE